MRPIDAELCEKKIREYADSKMQNVGYIEYCNEIIAAISAVKSTPTLNTWIPVSERLPSNVDEVITCNEDGVITIGYIRKRTGYYVCEHLPFVTEDVIAWQPLPGPYKEGEV